MLNFKQFIITKLYNPEGGGRYGPKFELGLGAGSKDGKPDISGKTEASDGEGGRLNPIIKKEKQIELRVEKKEQPNK